MPGRSDHASDADWHFRQQWSATACSPEHLPNTPGSSAELIEKLERFIALSPEEREAMGRRGREKMEKEFDREIVIGKYIQEAEA